MGICGIERGDSVKKERVCTREDILKNQEIMKKEPEFLDDVENWSYYVQEQKEEKPKHKKQRRRK